MSTAGVRAAGDGPRVGVATLSSGPWHLVIEVLLAHALRLRGARPELLLCDLPELPVCDERTIFSRSLDRCDGCVHDKRDLLDVAALPWRGVTSFLEADALARARRIVDALQDEDLEQFCDGGQPIGRWLHVSGCHFLRRDERGVEREQIDARRRLLAAAITIRAAADRWLDASQPDVVIVESGAHFMWKIVMELARSRGIAVVSREMGKGGWDRHLYALNADSMSPDLSAEWAEARQQELIPDAAAEVDDFLAHLPQRTYSATRYPIASASTSIAAPRTAVAFTNLTWDLATAGRDLAFDGMFDWLRETIRTVSEYPQARLVVRAHPVEAAISTRERVVDFLAREWPQGVPNVTVVDADDPVGASTLAASTDLTLTYTSTAGLEAAARGAAVVVAGVPHFRGKGFTLDVDTRDQYRKMLKDWALGDGPIAPPHSATLAKRYVHLFFSRYTIKMQWTTSPLEPPYRLTIASMNELLPGRNPALDVVCDGILTGRQIVLPPAVTPLPCAP